MQKVVETLEIANRDSKKFILCGDLNFDANICHNSQNTYRKEVYLLLDSLSLIGFGNNLLKEDAFFSKRPLNMALKY